MSYPMKETRFGYKEMTPQEYEEELNFYRSSIEDYLSRPGHLNQEYGRYLKRWFSDESCDGAANYETRYRFHRLPMAANTYMFE